MKRLGNVATHLYNDRDDEINKGFPSVACPGVTREYCLKGERTCGVPASQQSLSARQEKADEVVRWASCALECSTKGLG